MTMTPMTMALVLASKEFKFMYIVYINDILRYIL